MAGVVNKCRKCEATIYDEQTVSMLCDECRSPHGKNPMLVDNRQPYNPNPTQESDNGL